jgi:hypothetical protein
MELFFDLLDIVWQQPPPPTGDTLVSSVDLVLRLSISNNKTNNKTKQNINLQLLDQKN